MHTEISFELNGKLRANLDDLLWLDVFCELDTHMRSFIQKLSDDEFIYDEEIKL